MTIKNSTLILTLSAVTLPALIPAATQASGLEEILVTARRVQENQQNVPIAITSISAKDLENKNIANFEDLQYNSPALSFAQSLTRSGVRIQLRGQSAAYASDYPGVDTLFAEVPLTPTAAASLYDLSSVQVLKGPQGVAFGRNSTGGAVLLTPQKPNYEFSSYLKGGFGNFDYTTSEAMINVPLIDNTLSLRVAGNTEKRDGWTKNIATGHQLDQKDSKSIRVSLLFNPTESIENLSIFTYDTIDTRGSANHLIAYDPAGTAAFLYNPAVGLYPGPGSFTEYAEEAIALGRDEINLDFEGFIDQDNRFFANTTTIDITDSITVKNILGVQQRRGGNGTNMGGVPLPLIHLSTNRPGGEPSDRTYSDELQVIYTGMDGELSWVSGVYWSKRDRVKDGVPGESVTVGGLLISGGPTVRDSDSDVRSLAPYSQIKFPLNTVAEGLSMTLGARYTWDERDVRAYGETDGVGAFDGEFYNSVSGEWSDWNWEITLNYQANDNTLVYLAHRHGFKGGAFNPTAVNPDLVLVEPEYVDDIELGLKWDWSINDIYGRLNAAYYYQEYEDIVRTTYFIEGSTSYALNFNSGEAVIQGGELEALVQFTPNFSVSAFYSYMDSKIDSTVASSPVLVERVADVPKHKVGATIELRQPMDDRGTLSLTTTGYYQSKHYSDQAAVSPQSEFDAYTLFNANLTWESVMNRPLDISLFINNALDEEYLLGGADLYDNFGFVQSLYGEPRTYGMKLTYRWGAE